MANEKVLAGLQTIVTDLAQQADGHQLQSRIFASMGFTKLADKYAEHADEERGWVTKCIDRLLDLGCEVKLEAKREAPVCKNPVDWLRYDLEVSKEGLAWLRFRSLCLTLLHSGALCLDDVPTFTADRCHDIEGENHRQCVQNHVRWNGLDAQCVAYE